MRIGMVFQEARLLPWLTVRENAALAAKFRSHRRLESGPAVDEPYPCRARSFANAYPGQISGGMASGQRWHAH